MWFKKDKTLNKTQIQSALENMIKDGVASQAMEILTGGAFLVAFVVKPGASNFVMGLPAATGPWHSYFKCLRYPAPIINMR